MNGFVVSLLAAMKIQAAGVCPEAAEVERRLTPLLPPGVEVSAADVAAIQEDVDGALTVSLARADGGATTYRRLPRAPSCAEQAETVAVTLAVWEAQIHPEISLRLDRLSSAAPGTPVSPRAPLVLRTPEPTRTNGNNQVALGAGLAGAWQPGSLAPAGRVDVMLTRSDSAWRGRLSAAGVGQHEISLPPGQGNWWRVYLALGADYAIALGRHWAATVGAAGVLGMVSVAGSGYLVNHRTFSADLGGEALARLEWRRGRVRPWLGLAIVTWLRRQDVEVGGAAPARALPRVEPFAALGADFLWGR